MYQTYCLVRVVPSLLSACGTFVAPALILVIDICSLGKPGSKLFSVACLLGHCEAYIPYFWMETDNEYQYASVFYCWPLLPWLVRGYLVASRTNTQPPATLLRRFLANATAQGLVKASPKLVWSDTKSCWDH